MPRDPQHTLPQSQDPGRRLKAGATRRILAVLALPVVWWVGCAAAMVAPAVVHAQGGCDTVAIGVPIAAADTFEVAYFCRGIGEVFVAKDTLIKSISIWRPSVDTADAQPRILFITETDSTGVPDVQRLLLTGKSLQMPPGDGVHPVEYRFLFDPPFALPHKGKFFFDILATEFSSYPVPAIKGDPYPDGVVWQTGPVFYCDVPGYLFVGNPDDDLAFEVQFCSSTSVGTRRTSWGQVKTIYR